MNETLAPPIGVARAGKSTLLFGAVLALAALFLFTTTLAMLLYPGGTALDQSSVGYHFWLNFFSDLGRTHARNGTPNALSSALFTIGLSCAGAALMLFSVGFARLFWDGLGQRIWSALGAATGILAGLCFVGVAVNPADVSGHGHAVSVIWAFRFFLLSAGSFSAVIVRQRRYPRAYAWIFGAFTLLLFGYIMLIIDGPYPDTIRGLMIQATGQKVIVYAAILSVGAQAWAAREFVLKAGANRKHQTKRA